ncbi:MAG: GTP 3',8-cyclase MoaA [Actinobacteria bacterium]|nr:GTP 3',8-cyclase MoaA [Actinomycetota bacterium]
MSEKPEAKESKELPQEINYLRISITDRCNLRCVYCMPEEGVSSLSHDDIMSYEELETFARAAAATGINKIRITGGDPLVRRGIVDFVAMLNDIDPDLKISMTTNGLLLARYAEDLKKAGLSRINISIDSLDPDTYKHITRLGELEEVMEGLHAALDAGLEPVKINVVVLNSINDDPVPFANLTRELPLHVRFIEYMPFFNDPGKWYISNEITRARLESAVKLEEEKGPEGWGPAREHFKAEGALGTISFISPVSCHFCPSCNRIRISAEGRMRTCLFDRNGTDARELIRSGAGIDDLKKIIEKELDRKRLEGDHKPAPGTRIRAGDHMSRIGG